MTMETDYNQNKCIYHEIYQNYLSVSVYVLLCGHEAISLLNQWFYMNYIDNYIDNYH